MFLKQIFAVKAKAVKAKAVKVKWKIWKRKETKTHLIRFQCFIFYKPACLLKIFLGRLLSIRPFSADGHYLNNRVFLSRNYRLIVAQLKFDVLKTNICPRSEASRANMLVLRTSNFQRATIRPIVPRYKHYCLHCSSLNFLPHASSKISYNSIELFSRLWDKSRESQI